MIGYLPYSRAVITVIQSPLRLISLSLSSTLSPSRNQLLFVASFYLLLLCFLFLFSFFVCVLNNIFETAVAVLKIG